jgi:hypothetical protein
LKTWALLAICLKLFAAPIGNPSSPSLIDKGIWSPDTQWGHAEAFALGDTLFHKKFSADPPTKKMSINGQFESGSLIWNLLDWGSLSLEAGSGRVGFQLLPTNSQTFTGILSNGVVWSGSGKVTILKVEDTSFAIDGHAGGWDWMEGRGNSNGIPLPSKVTSKMRYWQVGVALTQRISLFSPYFGFVSNQTRLKLKTTDYHLGWMNASSSFGFFAGCSLIMKKIFFLNFEWRSWFEDAFSISGQLRF